MTDSREIDRNEQPHPLSVLAAAIVRRKGDDKAGTWDFQEAFKPYILLLDMQARSAEIENLLGTDALQEGRRLYLIKRAFELREATAAVQKRIAEMKL